MNVMRILIDHECEEEVIIAGILHDTVEDTPTTLQVIKRTCGTRVAEIIYGVTERVISVL